MHVKSDRHSIPLHNFATMPPSAFQPRWIHLFIGLAVLLNFSGLFVPIMALDAARYASIAKTMVLQHNWLELYCDHTDWLDKPHFPFWVTALFFKIFGINTWAYKLPGILFLLIGARYTWLFARRLYNSTIADWSVLILLTAQHIVISNNDVRAEPYLTGLIIASVYHFYRAYKDKAFLHLLLASLFAACAVMTKGIFALVPISGAIAGHLLMHRDWKNLFHWRWLIAAVLIFIFITPELYALWVQFDSHPEKVVFGQKGVSGIKFFFWDSQFGRFFNTGPIKGEGDPFFFVHTTLWAFLPWSLLLFAAIFTFIKKNLRQPKAAEWMSIFAAGLTFLMFSASRFQLPHYLNIVFPFFAVLTAAYIFNLQNERCIRRINTVQWVITGLLIVLIVAVTYLFQPEGVSVIAIILIVLPLLVLFSWKKIAGTSLKQSLIIRSALIAIAVNLFLNWIFYPALMKYQSASEAAFWLNENNKENLAVATVSPSYPMEFYYDQYVYLLQEGEKPPKPYLLYASPQQVDELGAKGVKTEIVRVFDEFSITLLDMQFVNKKTRADALKKMLLIRVDD